MIAIPIRKVSLLGLLSAYGAQLVKAVESWTRGDRCLISGAVLSLVHIFLEDAFFVSVCSFQGGSVG
jgi:hypothetical protein